MKILTLIIAATFFSSTSYAGEITDEQAKVLRNLGSYESGGYFRCLVSSLPKVHIDDFIEGVYESCYTMVSEKVRPKDKLLNCRLAAYTSISEDAGESMLKACTQLYAKEK